MDETFTVRTVAGSRPCDGEDKPVRQTRPSAFCAAHGDVIEVIDLLHSAESVRRGHWRFVTGPAPDVSICAVAEIAGAVCSVVLFCARIEAQYVVRRAPVALSWVGIELRRPGTPRRRSGNTWRS